MKFYSPLRYPGGKNKLSRFIALVCNLNDINGHYVEPYAGGASVALHLVINGHVKEVTINDLDRAIYAFWYSILNETDRFCSEIEKTKVTVPNWKKYKKIHKQKETASIFDLGFATFFLNRTNRSGIIDGGVIGGLAQAGNYKIDCRFNKKELIQRIRLIAQFKNKIHLENLDAMDLVGKISNRKDHKNTIFYFDPPYYLKGPSLYMSHYKHHNHTDVSKKIQQIKGARWLVSYDNAPAIKKLYADSRKKEYSFFHTAYEVRKGKEVIFSSKNLIMPRIAQPTNF